MNNLKKVKVEDPIFGKYETTSTFTKPTIKRKYIRILALCLVPMPYNIIYPRVKNPIMNQVRDMCRAGLLNRLTDGKRYYYQTTTKGRKLIAKVL